MTSIANETPDESRGRRLSISQQTTESEDCLQSVYYCQAENNEVSKPL